MLDRAVAAIGGKALVAGRPGIGWLVVEVSPAFVWTQITGAMSMEFYYFIAYLTLIGATDADLARLPMMVCAAGVVQVAIVLSRKPGDFKRRCVVDCWWARSLWAGTLLFPLIGWHLGWSVDVILYGVFASVFATHLIGMVSVAAFISWTQALVPRELRGVFYAWRQVHSYVVCAVILLAVAWLTQGMSQWPEQQRLTWLMALLGGATLVGIVGTMALAKAPGMPPGSEPPAYQPMLPRLRASAPLMRHVAWMCVSAIAINVSSAYQPKLFLEAGTSPEQMAWWQAVGFYPALLLAFLVTGWLLPRLHARPMLLYGHLAMIGAELVLLALTPANLGWLLPVALAASGVAKGVWGIAWIARLQEILPPGDPRFVSVCMGLMSLVGLLATIELPTLVVALQGWLASSHPQLTAAWVLVATGVAMRALATPLLLWPDRTRAAA